MKTFTLMDELATRLALIQTANGYHTNAGDVVLVEPDMVDVSSLTDPALRLFEQESVNDGNQPNTTQCKVKTFFVVEGVDKLTGSEQHTAQGQKLVSDICKAVFGGNVRMGVGNLQLQYEGHRILPRQQGSKAVVVQVRGSTSVAETFARPT